MLLACCFLLEVAVIWRLVAPETRLRDLVSLLEVVWAILTADCLLLLFSLQCLRLLAWELMVKYVIEAAEFLFVPVCLAPVVDVFVIGDVIGSCQPPPYRLAPGCDPLLFGCCFFTTVVGMAC